MATLDRSPKPLRSARPPIPVWAPGEEGPARAQSINDYMKRSGPQTERHHRGQQDTGRDPFLSENQHLVMSSQRSRPFAPTPRSVCQTSRAASSARTGGVSQMGPSLRPALSLRALPRKFSPAQSQHSGNRLHANHKLYEHRKALMRDQRTREMLAGLQEKPMICALSKDMVSTRQLQDCDDDGRGNAVPHYHKDCYLDQKVQEEAAECTHQPKINKKSKTLIENRVLENIQRKNLLAKLGQDPFPTGASSTSRYINFPQQNEVVQRPQMHEVSSTAPNYQMAPLRRDQPALSPNSLTAGMVLRHPLALEGQAQLPQSQMLRDAILTQDLVNTDPVPTPAFFRDPRHDRAQSQGGEVLQNDDLVVYHGHVLGYGDLVEEGLREMQREDSTLGRIPYLAQEGVARRSSFYDQSTGPQKTTTAIEAAGEAVHRPSAL